MRACRLDGKVCLVTGASRGIGMASARLFAQQGATVLLVGRSRVELEDGVNAIRESCGADRASAMPCDVSDDAQVKELFRRVFKEHKRLDVLLANAGVLDDALIGMVSRAQIEHVFGVNTFGLLYCAQYASRLMARGDGGSIREAFPYPSRYKD